MFERIKSGSCTSLIANRCYLCLAFAMLKETVNNDCDLKRLCHTVPRSVAEKGHCFIDDGDDDDDNDDDATAASCYKNNDEIKHQTVLEPRTHTHSYSHKMQLIL